MKRKLKNGTTVDMPLDKIQVQEAFAEFSAAQKRIIDLMSNGEHLFSTELMVGEYAEILVCDALNLTQEIASNKAYDAVDADGKKYQIKSRWLGNITTLKKNENTMEFGMIDEDVVDSIDYVVVLLFNPDFTINYCYMFNIPEYKKHSGIKKIKNKLGYSITPNKKKRMELDLAGCNITDKLR